MEEPARGFKAGRQDEASPCGLGQWQEDLAWGGECVENWDLCPAVPSPQTATLCPS